MQCRTEPNFGARLRARRMPCDFSAPANFAEQPVPVRHLPCVLSRSSAFAVRRCFGLHARGLGSASPGNFPLGHRDLSRRTIAKTHIRLCWIEKMRGTLSKIEGQRPDLRMRRPDRISRHSLQPRCAGIRGGSHDPAGFDCDSFLFYLTPAAIFDNRHGLLKSSTMRRRPEPCQPRSHNFKC